MTRLYNLPESLASTLELDTRKKQSIEESSSMRSKVGPEVTKSINPELNWKTVTKGRRTRKAVPRNVSEFAKASIASPKRIGDLSVSDSDKLDESATGHHFLDKVEEIPIKKRRHLLQSHSPPPLPSSIINKEALSPQPQTPSQHTDHLRSDSCKKQQLKGFGGSAAAKFTDDDTIFGVPDRELYSSDDFSGIALLAAAACIDSMDDVNKNVEKELHTEKELPLPEKFEADVSPNLRLNSCAELENPIQKEAVKDENVKSSSAGKSFSPSESLHENDDGKLRLVSSKVDRLHWDLNVVMDAWEQPFDDSVEEACSKDNSDHSIKEEKLEREVCETRRKSEDSQFYTQMYMPPAQTEENKSKLICAPDRDCSKHTSITKLDEHPVKSINSLHAVAENSNQNCNLSPTLNYSSSKSCQVSCASVDEEMMHGTTVIMQEDANLSNKVLSADNVKVGLDNIALPLLFTGSSARVGSINSNVAEVSGKISDLPQISTSSRIVSTVMCKTQEPENSGSNSYDGDHCQASSKSEDLSAASAASTHSAVCSPKGVCNRVSAADATVKEYQENVVLREPASKYDDNNISKEGCKSNSILPDSSRKDDGAQSGDPTSCSAKVASSFDDCHNSDVSQDDRSNMVVSKDMTELQAGYDSPYEDGEVRVSTSYPWEDDEFEVGKNECVDYESDAREGIDSDGADYRGSEVVEAGSEGSLGTENRSLVVREGSVSDFNRGGSLKGYLRMNYKKDDTEKIGNAGIEGATCGSGTTVGQFELNEDNLRRGHTSDYMDVVDMKGSRVEEHDSRAPRGMLHSRIEGPSSFGLSARKETSFLPQSRSRVYTRPGRDISPNKYMGRQRSTFNVRGGGDAQGGYWDSRNRFPSNYQGPNGHGYTRNRTMIPDSDDKFGGLNSQDHRQGVNYSSKSINRTLGRTSPLNRDDYYTVDRRMPVARDSTTNRGRGGFGNYMQRVGRGPREDHHEALADHRAASSGRMPPRYLSQRDRSFSPSSGRVPQNSLPRRKSRSRSRTRSPHAWHSRREWNQEMKRSSRSPDFRSEGRAERVRMPLQKPNFPADYSGSIVSSPPLRGRSSPQRNCRWVDDHDYTRRSPVRTFRRGPRFDPAAAAGSPRLKSENYFRRQGRFPPIGSTGKGSSKFDENYDDMRRDDRVESVHRPRQHSDTGGTTVNRSRHDAENNFEEDVRHAERPRTCREDKRSFNV